MSKPIALILAAAISLAPVGAAAGQTAVMGGGTGPPPQGSPGPGIGVTAPLGRNSARPPEIEGPIPIPRPLAGGAEHSCAPTPCVDPEGGGQPR